MPSRSGSVHKETRKIVEADVIVEGNDEDWDLEDIMMAKEVEANGQRRKICALQEKCCFACVEFSADKLAVVPSAEKVLDLERQATKREQALNELEQKLQVASSAASSAQYSALAKVENTREYRKESENAEEQLEVVQVAACKARENAKTAKQEVLKLEADYVAEVGREA